MALRRPFSPVRYADTPNSPFAAPGFRLFHLAPDPVKLKNSLPIDRVEARVVAPVEPFLRWRMTMPALIASLIASATELLVNPGP